MSRKRGKYEEDEEEDKYKGRYDDGFDISCSEEELDEEINETGDAFVPEFNEEQQIIVWVQRKYEPNPAKVCRFDGFYWHAV